MAEAVEQLDLLLTVAPHWMILGKVLGDIRERSGTYSKQDLQPYEVGWRAELEETLYRNWMANRDKVRFLVEVLDLGRRARDQLQEHERAAGSWQSEWQTVAEIVAATGSALSAVV